jgi:hypothetical protein
VERLDKKRMLLEEVLLEEVLLEIGSSQPED